ncbi:MAG: hypothetical protein J5654_09290 [Victivallales bacterium]|nr:hypothetical protein [Victivallales bacterium]
MYNNEFGGRMPIGKSTRDYFIIPAAVTAVWQEKSTLRHAQTEARQDCLEGDFNQTPSAAFFCMVAHARSN